ncbi:hypothetical protein SCB49_13180 [unidentified eubacterium SCB49]|nr:hypothetical protein SCB49_13180 [unidentified eubacterium SCB49]
MKKYLVLVVLFLSIQHISAQIKEIKIEEDRVNNRLMLYGVNENLQDLDVTITVQGTGFRQSTRKPRAVRIPATSKVNLMMLMVNKGETPNYTYDLIVNDSLSRRALRKQATAIKIDPKNPIIFYVAESCTTCDSLVSSLEKSPYRYSVTRFAEKPEIKEQIKAAIPELDTVSNAIVNLKGKLFVDIETLEELLEKL